ncbi:uncharacterized protein LOC132713601 isoform X2 [Ruditapes philippinarum]|uniref:uncharacterized protein LOC132713601 isoform X2 n=1 Tax=Ruditapes philippinarum TaxID=129788 RepID=UPI00295B1021|nr:uncharacterized protein LOC132713601 isoform X2 [Ruditapes philippinarum]
MRTQCLPWKIPRLYLLIPLECSVGKKKNRHYCEGKMLSEPQRGVEEADVVGVVVDVSSKWTRNQLHNEILKVLYLHRDVPSFLILNKIDVLRNHHLTRQQRLLLDVTRCLTDGKVGGKKFGRSKIERLGQKKPDKLFELLEQKYGALKNKRLKNVSKRSHKKIEIDSSQDLATQFSEITKTEVSKYLTTWLQVDFKARGKEAIKVDRSTKPEPVREIEKDVVEGIHKEKFDSKAVQKKMLGIFNQFHKIDETEDVISEQGMSSADVELTDDDTGELIDSSSDIVDLMNNSSNTGELKNDSLDTSELKNNSLEDYANVVMSSALKEEVGETENVNTVKGEDLDREVENKLEGTYLITECELSELEKGEFSEDKSDSEIVKNEFEESYQSEFLTRILSRPHEFSTDEDEARKDEEQRRDKLEISEEVEELKKAIEAVKDKYGWPRFDAVFPICALDGQGIDSLKDYLFKMSKPGDWIFHSSVITDQHPWDLAKQCVIQSFLDHVEGYMPYTFRPEIVYWDVDEHNRLNVSMEIFVSNKFEMRIILGKSESRISSITAGARQALMDTFQCEVRFKLAIRVHKKRGSK